MQDRYFIGVDAGTGSVRAGIFAADGRLVASARRDIALWQDAPLIAEQSSDDIWQAICGAVREALASSGLAAERIGGIGCDATCSMVVLGDGGQPLAVGAAWQPGAQRHRLDGSPRHRPGPPHQPHRPRRAGLCRRHASRPRWRRRSCSG